jgi:hypothetical protein
MIFPNRSSAPDDARRSQAGDTEADTAMDWLRNAVAAGYHTSRHVAQNWI